MAATLFLRWSAEDQAAAQAYAVAASVDFIYRPDEEQGPWTRR